MAKGILSVPLPDRGVVAVEGAGRVSFLQGLVTQDVTALAPDRALYAGLLNPQGKLLYDFFLAAEGETILVDIAAAWAGDFVRRLTLYKLRAAVQIRDVSTALGVTALFGAGVGATLGLGEAEGAARTLAPGAVFIDPRLAALGARKIAPRDETPGASPAEYVTHRLALGIADSTEIGGESLYPLEANFEALHGVDFRKGCYVGQELTARMKHRGGLRKRVLPVTGDGALPPAGTPLRAGTQELGPLIAVQGAQGLALLRLDRLTEAGTTPLLAGDVGVSVSWPAWLPR